MKKENWVLNVEVLEKICRKKITAKSGSNENKNRVKIDVLRKDEPRNMNMKVKIEKDRLVKRVEKNLNGKLHLRKFPLKWTKLRTIWS